MVRRGRYNFSKSVHNLNGGKQNKTKGKTTKNGFGDYCFFWERIFYFITRFKIMII